MRHCGDVESEAARPLFRRTSSRADRLLPARLRHAGSLKSAKAAVQLRAHFGHSLVVVGISEADVGSGRIAGPTHHSEPAAPLRQTSAPRVLPSEIDPTMLRRSG